MPLNQLSWQVRKLGATGSVECREASPEAFCRLAQIHSAKQASTSAQADLLITDDEAKFTSALQLMQDALLVEMGKPFFIPGPSSRLESCFGASFHFRLCCRDRQVSSVFCSFSQELSKHPAITGLQQFIGSKQLGFKLVQQQEVNDSAFVVCNDLTHMALLVSEGAQGVLFEPQLLKTTRDDFQFELHAGGLALWMQ